MFAKPAFRRLLAAEPLLRRSIPTLIIVFLIVIAAARTLSLLAQHDEIERNARTILALSAAELGSALTRANAETDGAPATRDLIERTAHRALLGTRHVLAVMDDRFSVVAASAAGSQWKDKRLDVIVSGGQPMFLFGERAGVMEVTVEGEPWFAAMDLSEDRGIAAAALVPQEAVFAEWTKAVSLNITLFVLTGRHPGHRALRLFPAGDTRPDRRPNLSRRASAHRSGAHPRPLRPVGLGHGARQDVLVALDV